MKTTYKCILKNKFTIVYLILMCIGILLTIGRWLSVFDNEFIMISKSFHYIAFLGLFIIASNFICETVMGGLIYGNF